MSQILEFAKGSSALLALLLIIGIAIAANQAMSPVSLVSSEQGSTAGVTTDEEPSNAAIASNLLQLEAIEATPQTEIIRTQLVDTDQQGYRYLVELDKPDAGIYEDVALEIYNPNLEEINLYFRASMPVEQGGREVDVDVIDESTGLSRRLYNSTLQQQQSQLLSLDAGERKEFKFQLEVMEKLNFGVPVVIEVSY